VGDDVFLMGCYVNHHSTVGDHCFVASGAVIAGNVTIGPNCFIGVNATIRDGITIAPRCVIGAGALIKEDTVEGSQVQHERAVVPVAGPPVVHVQRDQAGPAVHDRPELLVERHIEEIADCDHTLRRDGLCDLAEDPLLDPVHGDPGRHVLEPGVALRRFGGEEHVAHGRDSGTRVDERLADGLRAFGKSSADATRPTRMSTFWKSSIPISSAMFRRRVTARP